MPNTLAEQLRATLLRPNPTPTPPPAPIAAKPIAQVLDLPLTQICIDPHQPRHYFPAELRQRFAHGHITGQQALIELLDAAESQADPIAHGYLADLQPLAQSLHEVGQQQPIRVSHEVDQADPRYRIIDGERRFWAKCLLHHQSAHNEHSTIQAIVEAATLSADEIERGQWAANLCRDEVPAVDIAEAVWTIRERCLSRLSTDKQGYLAELGDEAATLVPREIVLRLTQREVAHLTGRDMQRRNLYRYLSIAEHLHADAKALARAYSISLSQLLPLIRLPPAQQVAAIHKLIGHNPQVISAKSDELSKGGRPNTVQRSINVCIQLGRTLQKLNSQYLTGVDALVRQSLIDELNAVSVAIHQTTELLKVQPTNRSIGG